MVKSAVIPRLIDKGLLHGKKEGNEQRVADDEALERIMRLGVEKFVYNQQGFSFVAVHAPIERVAETLAARPGVVSYDQNAGPQKMKEEVGVEGDAQRRHCFLVQMRDASQWSVLLQTIHWFHSCDAVMATALASALSRELSTTAAAAWDDDFSGSSLIVCENGEQSATVSDEQEGWETFYEFFYEQGIYLPESFIGTEGDTATLYVDDPSEVQRADRVVLKVPLPIESKGPHVFEKLGMIAEAMIEDLEDEEAFMEHMHSGIWAQAQSMLESGEV